MNWIKKDQNDFTRLKEGSICRTLDGEFIIAGEVNLALGFNDEFTEDITHYTEDFIPEIKKMLEKASNNFKQNK